MNPVWVNRKQNLICLLLCLSWTLQHSTNATPVLHSFEGYWIYGFEQSIFESCAGERYWVWVPEGFVGHYQPEGYQNPVKLSGYILSSNAVANMYSTLLELQVVTIEHADVHCKR